MNWTIVERSRIEVRPARPDDGVDLAVECDLRKRGRVAKGAVEIACKYRLEIDCSRKTLIEAEEQ